MDGDQKTLEDVTASLVRFGIADYSVFIAMLIVCSLVGFYFAWKDYKSHKNATDKEPGCETEDYLMGGRNMQVFPVAMSLVASFISGIALLGTGTEIYLYGTQYCYMLISIFASGTFLHFIIIPVLHDIKVTSVYEYLEKRFDVRVRLFGSIMYSSYTVMKMPIMIYVPALAFNQSTGINIHIITPIVMSICVLYTCLGGLKAVVWTDVIQIVQMYGVLILIAIKGTADVGGLSVVLERNYESGRLEAPDFRLDPTIRHTFWTLFIGGTVFWTTVNGLNQNMVQRYMALKDVKTAQKGQIMFIIGVSLMVSLCMYNGLLLYATYHDCDPLTTKLAKAKDQLMPLMAMEIFKDLPGLTGLFIAGVFSASLSSLSTGLNAMSSVVLEDFCKPFSKGKLSEKTSIYIAKGSVLILGSLSVLLVYVVQRLGTVLQLSMSLPPACFAPLLGIYIIGFTIPWIGNKATLYGGILGFITVGYVALRAQFDVAAGIIGNIKKPTSVEGCFYNFTVEAVTYQSVINSTPSKSFHNLSYLYFLPLGATVTIFSAFLLSFYFGFENHRNVDPRLFAPFMRKFFESSNKIEKVSEKKEITFSFVIDENLNKE